MVNDPALEKDVNQENWEEGEDGPSEDKPLIGRMLRLEPNQEELDGSILRCGEDDEGPEVIVPG